MILSARNHRSGAGAPFLLLLVGLTTVGPRYAAAQTPEASVDDLMKRIVDRLEKREFLSMKVTFSGGQMGQTTEATVDVVMAGDGSFSVRAASDGAELCGIVSDGAQVTEWDCGEKKWTRYPATQTDLVQGPNRLRLIDKQPAPVKFALSRFHGSWVGKSSLYEWFLQRIRAANEQSAALKDVNGARRHVLEATHAKRQDNFSATQTIRCIYDPESLLPLREETSVEVTQPIQMPGGSYTFAYDYDASKKQPDPAGFQYAAPEGYTFVDPEKLVAPEFPLVGKSVKDWTVPALDGEEKPLVREGDTCVLVVAWASWCLPCKAELEALQKMSQRGELNQVRVLAVSVDRNSEAMNAYLKRAGLPFGLAHDPEFSERLGPGGIPASILVDENGTVLWMSRSWEGDEGIDRIRAAIKKCGE